MENHKLFFADPTRDLLVIATVTNWDEPPRIRHEVAFQMSRFYNVLFVQIYCQRGMRRKELKYSDSIIVTRVGICFPGLLRVLMRFPVMLAIYNNYVSYKLTRLVKNLNSIKSILINFQFNAPELYKGNLFSAKYYFCNEDFVNQNLSATKTQKDFYALLQKATIASSAAVLTVSKPLATKLKEYGAVSVKVIHSAHNFDIKQSLFNIKKNDNNIISVAYMGVLNKYIEIDWLKKVCHEYDMRLTIIGPIYDRKLLFGFDLGDKFSYVGTKTGAELQNELLKHDVLVMPYGSSVDNEVTSVPGKLYQYLATGKPIVSSIMPCLVKLPIKSVYQSRDSGDFITKIRQAFNDDSVELRVERIKAAEDNTWDKRGDEIYRFIERDLAAVERAK